MRHAMLGDPLKDLGGIDLAQATVSARGRRNGPGEAPAVAVKHRQGPEIDWSVSGIFFNQISITITIIFRPSYLRRTTHELNFNWMLPEIGCENIADSVEICAPMVRDDALGITRR